MKRILSTLLAVAAVSACSVPALAADGRYLPIIPEFVSVGTSGGINVSAALDMVSGDAKEFFSDFYESPYLILLDQWTPTEYYPQYNTQGDQEYIGDDRKWSVVFVKPLNWQDKQIRYEFTYYDPLIYPTGYDSRPIRLGSANGYTAFDTLVYHYDFINKRFRSGTLHKSQQQQLFSYVIGSANLSHPVSSYPGYDTISGNVFTVDHAAPNGITRHYDWWIGQKNIENVEKPIPPIDPPVEPPIDPPPDPPIDPPDVKPDKPLDPFDPLKPPTDGGDDGYIPPTGDGDDPWFDYNPGEDVVIPPMPEFPTTPPTLPDVDDPFQPPTDLPSVDDPFKPPTDLPSVDDPFKPPTDLPSVDDPFKPPTNLPSVDDPFKPPTDLPSVDDPFKPPTDLPSVDDPFQPPTDLPSVDDPFQPPTDLPSVDDPFKPPTDLPGGGGFPSWGWGEGDYNPFDPPGNISQFPDPFVRQAEPRGFSFSGYNPFVIPDFLKKLFNLGN